MPDEEVEQMLEGVIEFNDDLFSIDGIKNYMRLVMKQPLIAAGGYFVYEGWNWWQRNGSETAFYGFLATAVLFVFVIWDANRRSVNVYQEAKQLKTKFEEIKSDIKEKNIEIKNSNAERMIRVHKSEFVIDHLKRNINILHMEILDEINFISEILTDDNMIKNTDILKTILESTSSKITSKVNRIDANAEAIGTPFDELRGKITTGELKAIPSPKTTMRKDIIEDMSNLKEEMEKDRKTAVPDTSNPFKS